MGIARIRLGVDYHLPWRSNVAIPDSGQSVMDPPLCAEETDTALQEDRSPREVSGRGHTSCAGEEAGCLSVSCQNRWQAWI